MLYALRKLIAFVFLGGIFWYIYRDLHKLWNPTFQLSVGVLVTLFLIVWLVVPPLVVYFRVRERRAKNRAGFAAWKAELGAAGPQPLHGKGLRLEVADGESIYFVEKGTIYADSDEGFGERLTPGRVGDVAFPALGGKWFKAQRVRFWLTDRRLVFVGKGLEVTAPLGDLVSFQVHAGGLVFTVRRADRNRRFAFTFHNPLVTAEVLRSLKK